MKPWHVLTLVAGLCIIALLLYAIWSGRRWRRGDRPIAEQTVVEQPARAGETPSNAEAPLDEKTVQDKAGQAKSRTPADARAEERAEMVRGQLANRDITDRRVLAAMRSVPRHEFVPPNMADQAYLDGPLPIGRGQTISQPYIVALMTQLADPQPDAVALDVGTGSGYQAAVLAELCDHVYSIEIVEELAKSARQRLARLGYDNVTVRAGDGYRGWPEHAPFDLIIVAAAPDHVPQPLIDQLKRGGRLVIPVGKYYQTLLLIEKDQDGQVERKKIVPVAFVPMTGQAADGRSEQPDGEAP